MQQILGNNLRIQHIMTAYHVHHMSSALREGEKEMIVKQV